MNAVTTAEYVVLEQIDPIVFQQEINAHAKQGYTWVSSQVFFDDSNRNVLYHAVMVREPELPAFSLERHFEQIVVLQQRVQELEQRVEWLRNRFENRLDEVEDKIDGSK